MEFKKFTFILTLLILFQISCTVETNVSTSLPRSTPEAEDIDPAQVLKFITAVESSGYELHSFMVLRHGKVVAEGWWDPYKPELLHTMYSTSKSFTSTAIGFAVTEKLITVNDKVISFFPEYLPDTVSENLADMEIRDLLSMTAGQDPEPTWATVSSDNWVKSFLEYPVVNKPGSVFLYNSLATYMLAAIINKVTGENVIDYLRSRLFEPLAITNIDWEVGPMGINTGGWGLRLKTEDMAKFGQLYLQKGKWGGQQIIPEEWVEEATTIKIDQAPDKTLEEKSKSDWQQGYCYKFWRSRHNSYRGDGAFGQLIMILPEQDAVIAVTAETNNMQGELNLIWDNLLPAFKNDKIESNPEISDKLSEKLKSLALAPPKPTGNNKAKALFSGKTFKFTSEESIYKTCLFNFEGETCQLELKTESDSVVFHFGENKWAYGETGKPVNALLSQPGRMKMFAPFKVAGAFNCPTENTIDLSLRYIESPHTEFYKFNISDDKITLEITNSRNGREKGEVLYGIATN